MTGARLDALVDANVVGITVCDEERILAANDVFLATLGVDRAAFDAGGGLSWQQLTPPEWEQADRAAVAALIEHGRVDPYEKEYERPDGRRVPVVLAAALIAREPFRCICFVLDLAPLKSTERAQAAELGAERELRVTLERVADFNLRVANVETPGEVARAICDSARSTFDAPVAALWRREGEDMLVLWRTPPLSVGKRVPLRYSPGLAEQLETGEPRFIADLERENPLLWEHHSRELGTRAQLRLPLYNGEPAQLVLAVSWNEPRPGLSPALLAGARRFADQASAALAHAERRRAERDAQRLYEQLEESLLPEPDIDPGAGVSVKTLTVPGEQRMRLGGDFLDAVSLPSGGVALVVGDVAGHGPQAAALGADLRSAWRALALAGLEPPELVAALERGVEHRIARAERMVTMCASWIDPAAGRVRVMLAGHPPPVLLGGAPLELTPGPPLGVVSGARWPLHVVELAAGDRLLFYTDGIVEGRAAPGGDGRYGEERLRTALAALGREPDDVLLERLLADAVACHGGALPDDVALLLATVGRIAS